MPELPEVETVRRTLHELIIGKTIEKVEVRLPRIIQRPADVQQFSFLLQGQRLQAVERRGKFLRLIMDQGVLVSHLRMEGRYGVYQADDELEPHTHVLFTFTDGSQLRYRDVRQFGTMHFFAPGEDLISKPLNKLGVEPLSADFTLSVFQTIVSRPTKIKPLLLNQERVVGLGNIYVDEALFTAGIHPETAAHALTRKQVKALYHAIIDTLQAAVDAGGTSVKSYVNGQGEMGMFQQSLQVYGRKGEACPRCQHEIERIVVAGRGTHFCLRCQKLKNK